MDGEDQKPSLESPLISQEAVSHSRNGAKREEILGEVKKQLKLAGPLMSVNVLLYSLQAISVMFVGHLGELALSGASMATSFASVTGFSLIVGMGSALDTFCGQSFGAKQYHMLGVHKQRAMVVLLLVSIPVAFIWNNTGHILASLGQDPEISAEAGLYAHFMIPSIFAFALLQCHIRFLQAQNNVVPMMITTGFTTLLHALTCWMLVFKSVWSVELMVLLSGLLPNPKLETSVLSISLNIYAILYMIFLGISGATSIRVSNELGAGRTQAALLAVYVALFMVAIEGILVATTLILGRNFWGYSYSSEEKVVNYVGEMMFLLAGSHFIDGIQSVLSAKIGALVNLGAYYLAGIPSGALLAFVYHIGGKVTLTLFLIFLPLFIFPLFLAIIILCTDWEKEAKKATDRVYDSMVL
ncbi:hypothetical protein AAG906_020220 [Vitis piasezkii]